MIDFFKEYILPYLVPCITVVVSFFLGRVEYLHSTKLKKYEERYRSFYVPYVSLLYKKAIWKHEFCMLVDNDKEEFLNLIMDNLQYLGESSQAIIPDFYQSFPELQEWYNYKSDDKTGKEVDLIFFTLTNCILSECKHISRILKLPDIGSTVSKKFSQSTYWQGLAKQVSTENYE